MIIRKGMLQKTIGIVLRTIKYNDSSIIANIYTDLYGHASFIVKVPHSKKAVVKSVLFQPLALIEFEANYRAMSGLHRISEAKSFAPFHSIPYDPYKSAIALFISEFLFRALREETENRPLFAYLIHSIKWFDECKKGFANFHLVFLIRLSRFLGLYPNLENYHKGACFDLMNANFVTLRPFHSSFISPEESYRLTNLIRMNYDTMYLFRMTRNERNRCLTVINDYYRLHLPDFPVLKSLEILNQLFDD